MRYQHLLLWFVFNRALLVTAKCVDSNESFQIRNGQTKSCEDANLKWCNRPMFKLKCPFSCDQCILDEPLQPQAGCVDSTESFFLKKSGEEKSCEDAKKNEKSKEKWCGLSVFKENCKATCDSCPDIEVQLEGGNSDCVDKDWEVKYELQSGESKKSCLNASQNTDLCRHKELKENCRRTCGLCNFPSAAPSVMPSSEPSSNFPSTTPSTQFPSQTPSTKKENCVIDATLRYPTAEYHGYHSDM